MADLSYNEGRHKLATGDLVWTSDTIKAMLVTDTYSPDPDDSFLDEGGASDPVDAEISATGYGRILLTGLGISKSDADDRIYFTADHPVWSELGNGVNSDIAWLLVYKEVTLDTDSYLISAHDMDGETTIGAPFQPTWDSRGVWFI